MPHLTRPGSARRGSDVVGPAERPHGDQTGPTRGHGIELGPFLRGGRTDVHVRMSMQMDGPGLNERPLCVCLLAT